MSRYHGDNLWRQRCGDKPFILPSRLLGKIEGPEARSTLKVPVMGFWLRVSVLAKGLLFPRLEVMAKM
jgi:hypothetical protein